MLITGPMERNNVDIKSVTKNDNETDTIQIIINKKLKLKSLL